MSKLFHFFEKIFSFWNNSNPSLSGLKLTAATEKINTAVEASLVSGSSLTAVGAGIAMIGAIGVGAGQGIAVGRGLDAIARNPEFYKELRTTLILGLAIVESSSIYCVIVALILAFK